MFLIKAEKSCCFLFSDFATITLSVFLMSVRYSSLILSIREMILFLNFGQRLTLFSDFLSVGCDFECSGFLKIFLSPDFWEKLARAPPYPGFS